MYNYITHVSCVCTVHPFVVFYELILDLLVLHYYTVFKRKYYIYLTIVVIAVMAFIIVVVAVIAVMALIIVVVAVLLVALVLLQCHMA